MIGLMKTRLTATRGNIGRATKIIQDMENLSRSKARSMINGNVVTIGRKTAETLAKMGYIENLVVEDCREDVLTHDHVDSSLPCDIKVRIDELCSRYYDECVDVGITNETEAMNHCKKTFTKFDGTESAGLDMAQLLYHIIEPKYEFSTETVLVCDIFEWVCKSACTIISKLAIKQLGKNFDRFKLENKKRDLFKVFCKLARNLYNLSGGAKNLKMYFSESDGYFLSFNSRDGAIMVSESLSLSETANDMLFFALEWEMEMENERIERLKRNQQKETGEIA